LKLSPAVSWTAGLVTLSMMGDPGQLVAPGETFSVTVTPAMPHRTKPKVATHVARNFKASRIDRGGWFGQLK
jgi:hypothetical protein